MNFEINQYGDTILPAVAQEDVVEGRMVRLTSQAFSVDFGSQSDLPGCLRPTTDTLAGQSRYVIAFVVDNQPTPFGVPMPAYTWALREGWDQATNVPFSTTVYLTHQGNMDTPQTIPSGANCRLFGEGIYTVPSGGYVYSVNVETPGCQLTVANVGGGDAAADAGKLKYGTSNIVAEVFKYNTADASLTFKILH